MRDNFKLKSKFKKTKEFFHNEFFYTSSYLYDFPVRGFKRSRYEYYNTNRILKERNLDQNHWIRLSDILIQMSGFGCPDYWIKIA